MKEEKKDEEGMISPFTLCILGIVLYAILVLAISEIDNFCTDFNNSHDHSDHWDGYYDGFYLPY